MPGPTEDIPRLQIRKYLFHGIKPVLITSVPASRLGRRASTFSSTAHTLAAETFVAPISAEAWGYEVSGYEVLPQRVKHRVGLPLTLKNQR
jgi:hypothetical protein